MKKAKKRLEFLVEEIDSIKETMSGKDREIKILKEVILELKKCNDILLKENLQFKEKVGYCRF
ncbi:MAG: hypothetical protein ACLFOC_10270 [Campylobacterales bacterium]